MDSDSKYIQSVYRALLILSCFSAQTPQLRVIDLAQKLDLTQSNVSRLLTTMSMLGYVEKDEHTGYYHLGPEIIALSGVALNDSEIRKQALPELHMLQARLDLHVYLGMQNNGRLFYLASINSPSDAHRAFTPVGYTKPLHCTAIGKLLLAFMPEAERAKALVKPLRSYTPNTITQPETLKLELSKIRRCNYSVEMEEMNIGKACIVAPILNRDGKVIAGISLSGAVSKIDLPAREKELSRILLETALCISEKLGYFPH